MLSANVVAIAFGALLVGILMGLIPLIVGLVRKQNGLAIGGFIACVISGLILGLILALPVAIIFLSIILVANNNNVPTFTAPMVTCRYCGNKTVKTGEHPVCEHCGSSLL